MTLYIFLLLLTSFDFSQLQDLTQTSSIALLPHACSRGKRINSNPTSDVHAGIQCISVLLLYYPCHCQYDCQCVDTVLTKCMHAGKQFTSVCVLPTCLLVYCVLVFAVAFLWQTFQFARVSFTACRVQLTAVLLSCNTPHDHIMVNPQAGSSVAAALTHTTDSHCRLSLHPPIGSVEIYW